MSKTNLRSQVAKLIQKSSLPDEKKQKLIFALPKMEESAVKELHRDLEKIEKEQKEAIHVGLEERVARDEKVKNDMEKLYQEMGVEREEVAGEGVDKKEAERMTQELLDEAAKDPKKLTAFLIALGPDGMKKLEKSVERLKADPKFAGQEKDIEDTVKKLRSFSADVYKSAREIEENFKKQVLIEQIKVEKEKQETLKGYMRDLEVIKEVGGR
ncbi:MAG: hypothetical protein Q8O95_05090 [bacterium]|nr:hypothetical protein [bacterium]